MTQIWNKQGNNRLGVYFSYRDEKAFIACQKIINGVPQGRWKTILKQTRMKHKGMHHLRHTHVANWCSVPGNNKDPYALQRRLGHQDFDTTLRKYGHYFDFAEREKTLSIAEKIKEMVAKHR